MVHIEEAFSPPSLSRWNNSCKLAHFVSALTTLDLTEGPGWEADGDPSRIPPSGYFHPPVCVASKPSPTPEGRHNWVSCPRTGGSNPVGCGQQGEKTPFRSSSRSGSLLGGQRGGAGRCLGVPSPMNPGAHSPRSFSALGARHGRTLEPLGASGAQGEAIWGENLGLLLDWFFLPPNRLLAKAGIVLGNASCPWRLRSPRRFPTHPRPRPPTTCPAAGLPASPADGPGLRSRSARRPLSSPLHGFSVLWLIHENEPRRVQHTLSKQEVL